MGLKDKTETSKHLLTDDPSARTGRRVGTPHVKGCGRSRSVLGPQA